MKLPRAINENEWVNPKLSEHFGHCPYFAIYETEIEELQVIINELNHPNPNISPVDQIMKFKPDIVFTFGIGQRAIRLSNEKGVKLRTYKYEKVKEVIENIDALKKLESGDNH